VSLNKQQINKETIIHLVHLPPPSINSVIVSTLSDPPNSSTEGAKIMRCSYKNSPYFERTRLASSADLKVSEYPLPVNKMKLRYYRFTGIVVKDANNRNNLPVFTLYNEQ
jgi:hypothetical protein